MSPTIKADGDTWRAELDDEEGEEGRAILFFCTTTDQRPYRVAWLPAGRFARGEDLEGATQDELRALFAASRSMGAPREYPTYGS